MATHKSSPKAPKLPKKGSKLASLKSAIFGATKKKAAADKAARPAVAASKGHASAPKKVEKAPVKKAAPISTTPPVKGAPTKKGAAHSAHVGSNGKAAAPAAAPTVKPGPALTKKPRGQNKKVAVPVERMAGPSIRISYDSNGEAVCREVACEGLSTSSGYCRMHYIKNWKKIKRKEVILKEGKLNQYIEELVAKYPDKYIEAIRQDLANDKDFAKVIYDLDLDESVDDFDPEGENLDSIVGDIKRDFDDDGDTGF